MRVFLLLVAACVTTVAQESRPIGLLPPESPLAPIQEALLRGEAAEARAALDAFLATAAPEALAALAPQAALLRAAAEPVESRAAAMLGVATAYADRPWCETAAVAGIAALLVDGPEIGDLAEPLLPGTDAPNRQDSGKTAPSAGPTRDAMLGSFLELLEMRAMAPDKDVVALDHARRLLAQFPSHANDWVRVRPSGAISFPARLDQSLRLRFFELPAEKAPWDPTRVILPDGAPKIDVTLPANQDGLELPALGPGTWLVVATGAEAGDRRAWPVMVSDLEVIAHSVHGRWKALALSRGRPDPAATLTTLFDPRLASRTRSADRKEPDNAVLARSGTHAATAPIATPQTVVPPETEQRLVADLWCPQPVHHPGKTVQMRLCVRPLPAYRTLADVPIRIVLWPRQPHEVVIEKRQADVIPIEVGLPASTPPGPVRVQVFDAGQTLANGVASDPILDTTAFTVQGFTDEAAHLLMSAPSSWKAGDAAPTVDLLGLFQRDAPAAGLEVMVAISSGSFRQEVPVVLDDAGAGSLTIALDAIQNPALERVPHVDVSARLQKGGVEIATANRRIAIVHPPKPEEGPVLLVSVLKASPIAGEPLPLAITGPADETVLLTVATRSLISRHEAEIGSTGRTEVSLPTEASWSAVEILASTRSLKTGRLEKRIRVVLGRADAPTLAIETDRTTFGPDDPDTIPLRVTSKTPLDKTTVSVAIVDDRIIRFSGVSLPAPDAALRPTAPPLSLRSASSPAPLEPAAWYATVLARDERLSQSEARLGMAAGSRGLAPPVTPGATLGSIVLSGGTPEFKPSITLDAAGVGQITLPEIRRMARSYRIIAVAIDGEGRSAVAERTITLPGTPVTPRERHRVFTATAFTYARAFLEAQGGRTATAILSPARLGTPRSEEVKITSYPFPARVASAIEHHLLDANAACADHLAARVAYDAKALDGLRGGDAMRGPPRSLEAIPAPLLAHLAGLRDLATRDGWAWQRGETTDFEAASTVLQALAIAADAGVDPVRFSAFPETHDGFLRAAPRAFAEAQGNPQAALDNEEVRSHATFNKSVPPERRAIVLVDTVIGMLAVDPKAGFAKLGVASLLRQTIELPGATLARAGLAMLRAGDRESAQLALKRLEAVQDDDVERLALHLQLARLLDAPEAFKDELSRRLAKSFTQDPWPTPFACALAFGELEPLRNQPGTVTVKEADDPSKLDIPVESNGPAIVFAERSALVTTQIAGGGNPVPAVRLEANGRPLDPSAPAVAAGSQVRVTVSVMAPGRPFAIQCPVANGMRVLRAPKASVNFLQIEWLFRSAPAGTPIEVEAVLEVDEDLDAWNPVTVLALDTLDVIGWSQSTRFKVTEGTTNPLRRASQPPVAMDVGAIGRSLGRILSALEEAPDKTAKTQALKELLDAPNPDLPGTLVSILPKIAPLLESPDMLATIAVALGEARATLWARDRIDAVTGGGRRTRLLAELVHADAEATQLIADWRGGLLVSNPAASRLAGLIVLARLRTSDSAESASLWDPDVLLRLWSGEDLPDADARAERISASVELPFHKNFARLFGGTEPVTTGVVDGWIKIFDLLERKLQPLDRRLQPASADGVTLDLLALVAAITERSAQETGVFTRPEIAFRIRQGELRAIAAARGVELLELGALPTVEAANLSLLTSVAASDHLPRVLRVLLAPLGDLGAVDSGGGNLVTSAGVQLLRRHRDQIAIDDRAGAMLVKIAASGPRAWRVPAVLAITSRDRRRVPISVIAQLLRDPESTGAAIELLVERDDAADLLSGALEMKLSRREARTVIDRLSILAPRPFERTALPRLLALLAQLDPDSARPVEEEIRRRAEDNPAEVARALAASRDERARTAVAQILAKLGVTDVPWEAADPLADRLRTKLLALAGDAAAGDQVRRWMAAAIQSSQSQGSADPILQELWPILVRHATPLDVLVFGAPAQAASIESRAAEWSPDAIGAFLRSPEARPDPSGSAGHVGTVAAVVRLVGPARLADFTSELLALWRADVEAGLAFDALSLFGQMGAAQIPALREVLAAGGPGDSRSVRFPEPQQLAYVTALSRDPAIHREAEPILRASRSPEIAAALARYTLESTGFWKEPAPASTRPTSGPRTPQDWQRALMTRLRNDGLNAVAGAEPPVIEAWQKTLRERGLLAK